IHSEGDDVCKLLIEKVGERGRNRTFNLLIKSQLLCQLSYAPACEESLQKGNQNYTIARRAETSPQHAWRSGDFIRAFSIRRYSICTNWPVPTDDCGVRSVCGARQKSIYDT